MTSCLTPPTLRVTRWGTIHAWRPNLLGEGYVLQSNAWTIPIPKELWYRFSTIMNHEFELILHYRESIHKLKNRDSLNAGPRFNMRLSYPSKHPLVLIRALLEPTLDLPMRSTASATRNISRGGLTIHAVVCYTISSYTPSHYRGQV